MEIAKDGYDFDGFMLILYWILENKFTTIILGNLTEVAIVPNNLASVPRYR
jgi:hypothetical protein